MRAFYFVAAMLFALMLPSVTVMACSCMGGGSPCQGYGGATAVFVGTVIDVRTKERTPTRDPREIDWSPRTFKFSIEEPFLGVAGANVEIATGTGGGDCGYDFKIGERYLVYAYRYSDEDSRLSTGICTRTRPYAKAEEDLEFLRRVSSLDPGITISGEVKRQRESVARGNMTPVGPLADASLIIEGADQKKEIRTDEQGRYRVSGLPAGKYKLKLLLPDELITARAEQEVTVGDRGCTVVNYYVVDNGRISGTAYDAEGEVAPHVLLTLIEADNQDSTANYNKLVRTDDQGHFTFSALPPGRYFLAVNAHRFPEPDDITNAYPRTYYPGAADVSQAKAIKLAAGENVRGVDLRLPQRRSPSTITGKVVWEDGEPVANAGISFKNVTYHDPGISNGLQADEQGYFTIKAYVGETFQIEARSNRPYVARPGRFEPMERAEQVRITLVKPSELVKIVITRLR